MSLEHSPAKVSDSIKPAKFCKPTGNIVDDYPYSIKEAGHCLGKGVTTMYTMLNEGEIKGIRLRNQTRIMGREIRRVLETAPAYKQEV